MKAAVISDIHGNMQALESVLQDINQQNCDKVFCLGDLAMAGPQPRAVIDFFKNQKDWEVIQGNTDKMISDFTPEIIDSVKSQFPVMANALLDDVLYIEEERKDYLRKLEPQKKLEVEGVKILLVHGSPRKNNENILPDLPINEVEEMIEGEDADVIFCGHTHIPCGYQTNKKQTVINVGSVGRLMTGERKACYVVADFEDGGFSVEHRFVDYDYETAAAIIRQRGFEGAEKLAEMLTNPTFRHI